VKVETAASIHLPLDHFQSIDLALDLAGAPQDIYGCGDG
jgi:hypothetical protein